MKTTKVIALILLAVYLFFNGALNIFNISPPSAIMGLLGLCAIGAGILILIAIKEFAPREK